MLLSITDTINVLADNGATSVADARVTLMAKFAASYWSNWEHVQPHHVFEKLQRWGYITPYQAEEALKSREGAARREARREARCDSAAARKFESAAYGDD